MASNAPFTLSRAIAEDMTEIVEVQYECFPQFVQEAFMGCFSRDDLPRLTKHYIDEMETDPHVVWIKLVENAKGKIVAATQWKVFPSREPESNEDKPPPWLEGEMREKSAKIMRQMNMKRRKANPSGYVREFPSSQPNAFISKYSYYSQTSTYASRILITAVEVVGR